MKKNKREYWINLRPAKTNDYVYCLDCREYVDLWKEDIKETNHYTHNCRFVTETELETLNEECWLGGCFKP